MPSISIAIGNTFGEDTSGAVSGPGAGVDNLLMESGDNLLLESGDVILLEG